ncbi:MAG TPA: DUF1684 domain-containing protein [Lysobacter sp.]
MRRLWLCFLLLCFPCLAATKITPHQEWLAFREAVMFRTGGPTGAHAIQDMVELQPGEAAYLIPGKSIFDARWSKQASKRHVARVENQDNQAIISGPGIDRSDLMRLPDRALQLPNKLTTRVSRLDKTALKVWLYNANLPARKKFKGVAFYPYSPRGVVKGVFRRNEKPTAVNYLDSRDHAGVMYVVGTLEVELGGKKQTLKAYNYKDDWSELEWILLLLKDDTSGKTSYGGGRVTEVHFPKGTPPRTMTVNLNTLYSFLCAHSDYYNCPLMLTDRVDGGLPYGEKYPPL